MQYFVVQCIIVQCSILLCSDCKGDVKLKCCADPKLAAWVKMCSRVHSVEVCMVQVCLLERGGGLKLDGLGPVDNKSSTD